MAGTISRLTSRKFLAALSAFLLGLGMILGGSTDSETVLGTVMALASVIAYIFGEATVDVARLNASGAAASAAATATSPATAAEATTAAVATAKGMTDAEPGGNL